MEVMDRKAFKYAWKALILMAIPIRYAYGLTKEINHHWPHINHIEPDVLIRLVGNAYLGERARENRLEELKTMMVGLNNIKMEDPGHTLNWAKPNKEKFYDAYYKKNRKGHGR